MSELKDKFKEFMKKYKRKNRYSKIEFIDIRTEEVRELEGLINQIDDEWISVGKSNNYPDPEKHRFILGIDMNDSEPYAFECKWDGDTWSNIGGESFTHWKPSSHPLN